jgi:hypothetical protein
MKAKFGALGGRVLRCLDSGTDIVGVKGIDEMID